MVPRVVAGVVVALALTACGGASTSSSAPAATPGIMVPPGYKFVPVAFGFDSPVHVTAPRNEANRLYVVEQKGRIRVVESGRLLARPFLDIRGQVSCCGEQGLLSVAFHPRYAQTKKYYVNYTDRAGDTRVVEYRGARRLRQLLFVDQPYPNHNGGQNLFGPDGRLYVGMGDGGSGGDPENRAQNLGTRLGKLIAINVDKRGAKPQIVGYGLRNPWRFSFDRKTGDLYIGDVGQNSWEEISFTRKRSPGLENYGWDVYEGRARHESKAPNPRGRLVFPVAVYSLSGAECAVAGGFVYRGTAVPAAQGRYFYGDTCSGAVWSFKTVNGKARGVRREGVTLEGLSSWGEDPRGELYAVTLGGRLLRLTAA
ncbi:MAG: PQQ-dependent sugar dehydrogenase [Actinobacteria bacterium]|nr:PQQ-dependent sugar dehydrogenase [Actinomycetota bacterium]